MQEDNGFHKRRAGFLSITKRLMLMNIASILVPTLLMGVVINFVLGGFAYSFEQETGATIIEYVKSLPVSSEQGASELLSESAAHLMTADASGNIQEALKSIAVRVERRGLDLYIIRDGAALYSSNEKLTEQMSVYAREAIWAGSSKATLIGETGAIYMESFKSADSTVSVFMVDKNASGADMTAIRKRAKHYFSANAAPILMAILFILAMSCGLLASAVSGSITRKIAALKRGMEEVRDGNLNVEIRIKGRSYDELSQLCEDFNEMRQRLSESISMRIQYEQNRKALLATISHDLRTPITSIKGYVDGLLDGVASTPEQRLRYLNTIKNKAEEMNILADNLFLFSTLDMGQAQFNMERVEMGDYLNDCAMEMEYQYERENMYLSFESLCESPVFAMIDRAQFKRIIINILENCSKYRRSDGVNVGITLSRGEGMLSIGISDDGIGIPEDQLERVFDQFYRVDDSRSGIPGNGLGLAIVKQIVDAHGGTIEALGAPGGGTTMMIKLVEV